MSFPFVFLPKKVKGKAKLSQEGGGVLLVTNSRRVFVTRSTPPPFCDMSQKVSKHRFLILFCDMSQKGGGGTSCDE